ncbi:hypothetical protein Save01_09171 [Streptomyces avermitilis]
MRRRLIRVESRWECPVAEGHHHLDHSGHARGGLCVSDVGLDGAQPQRPVAGTVLSVGREDGLGLDRVAQSGAGAVGLHRIDVGGGQVRVGEGLADDALLGGPVGRGQTVARTVLVDRTATHHGQDTVTVAAGVGEPLHQQHPHTLTPAGTVSRRRERLATPVGGESALAGEFGEGDRGGHDRGPAGQGHGAFTGPEGLAGEVQGDERGGTRCVEGDRRPFQPEDVGDSAGGDAGGCPGQDESLGTARGLTDVCRVVLSVGAGEDSGGGAVEGVGVDAGVFDGFPGGFEEESLLGVHGEGFAGADAEEFGVEVACVVEESAVSGVAGAGVVGVGVVERVQVPAAVGGESADRVLLGGDQIPEVVRRGHSAGETTGHANDGDRLGDRSLGGNGCR